MGQKRSPELVTIAKRLRNQGRTFAEIAEELSKKGKNISKASIVNWLREPPGASTSSAEPPAAPSTSSAEPVDETEMTPEELARWLGVELRQARVDAAACRARNDEPGASRALRQAAGMASMLQRIHARAGDDVDFVRVRQVDVAAAAEKARSKLHDLVARLAEKRTR